MADPFNDETEYDFNDLPGGYKEPYLATTKQQADSETNAMELLRQSMQRSAEVSPTQGLASALLAAVPTLGGYLIGRQVGTPDVSGLGINSFDEYKKIAGGTGGFAGGAMGAQIGAQSSGGYLKGLDEEQAARADVLQKQAQLEAQKAARAQTEKSQLLQRGLAQADEERMLPLRERSQMRIDDNRISGQINLQNAKPNSQKTLEAELADPEKKAAFDSIASGGGTVESYNKLSPLAQAEASKLSRASTYRDYFEMAKGKTELPGFDNVAGNTLNTQTVQKITEERRGISRTKTLLNEYISRPDEFTGDTSAVQAAVSGMLMNAQRMATNSGASFTETEQNLIKRALPAIAAGDLTGWLKQESLGRDQKVLAQTLSSLYEKVSDYELADSLGLKRSDKPAEYYPVETRKKWGFDSYGVSPSMASNTPSLTEGTPAPVQTKTTVIPRIKGESVAAYKARVGM